MQLSDKAIRPVRASGSTTRLREARGADIDRTRLAEALIATGNEDRQAFSDVYRLTFAELYRVCFRVCGEQAAAQDVLQEVYLKIWRNAGAFELSQASPMGWLAVMARNRAIDWKRTQGRRTVVQLEEAMAIADPVGDPETITISTDENRRLNLSLHALDKRQRDAIQSAFLEDLTYQEVARRVDAPLGTVKSNIRRGLAKLRAQLDNQELVVRRDAY